MQSCKGDQPQYGTPYSKFPMVYVVQDTEGKLISKMDTRGALERRLYILRGNDVAVTIDAGLTSCHKGKVCSCIMEIDGENSENEVCSLVNGALDSYDWHMVVCGKVSPLPPLEVNTLVAMHSAILTARLLFFSY